MDAEPLVMPFDPGRGWDEADLPRRVFAVLGIAVVPVLALGGWWSGRWVGWLVVLALTLGPPACYSLARVLRPHARSWSERTVRHALASTATAASVPVLAGLARATVAAVDSQFGMILFFLGVPAASLGLTTTVWGTVALGVRLSERRLGRRPLAHLIDPREPGLD